MPKQALKTTAAQPRHLDIRNTASLGYTWPTRPFALAAQLAPRSL
jgi:hypothetical protein